MAWALGTTVSTRGGGHTTGAPGLETTGALEVEKAAKVFGLDPSALDPLGYEGKPQMVVFTEVLHRVANCLGICHFNTVWSDLDLMSLDDMAKLLSAATGCETSVDQLKVAAMRQLNLERAFNFRHTGFGRVDDMPAPRDLNEPIPTGNLAGWAIDEARWNKMLSEYYELHGWDAETGHPKRNTLERYGLGHVADDLDRIGKLG
jgi:aldehyde:ferredoxin oxidoreductase